VQDSTPTWREEPGLRVRALLESEEAANLAIEKVNGMLLEGKKV